MHAIYSEWYKEAKKQCLSIQCPELERDKIDQDG